MNKDIKRLNLTQILNEEAEVLKISSILYENSFFSKEAEFKKEYDKLKDNVDEYICVYLFYKMYFSEIKVSLNSFEFLINKNIDKSTFFLRRIIKEIIEDENKSRNTYKAIVIKTIKNHENKLELYKSIRKVYNMKYFFSRVKSIEKLNRIMEF
jgi:hypothetical protein